MSERSERLLNFALTAATVVLAAVVVIREFGPAARADAASPRRGLTGFDEHWRETRAIGRSVGDTTAPLQLVEYIDLECGVCRTFHRNVLIDTKARYGEKLAVSYVHWPLSFHKFARPSAQAAECAAAQGKFEAFLDAVFEKQDSLGLKSWGSFASQASVPDTVKLTACLRQPSFPGIDAGVAMAERRGIQGTPTVIVNGWVFNGAPSATTLWRVMDDILAGRKPALDN